MDLKDIKAIIDLMKKNSVSEFEMEKEDFKIRLKRAGQPAGGGGADEPQVIAYSPAVQMPAPNPSLPPNPGKATSNEMEITSPMIGTFYRSPSPESAPYIEIGAEVDPETVVCIIEAMKVMNEIKAEAKGVITEVLVDNAKPVEFGQALFKIRPT